MDNPLAIVFDMDGVLVDTYQAHYRSWLEMCDSRLDIQAATNRRWSIALSASSRTRES
jgi:beta-phosphoglucomutase-like phosphatase (HAD superfamily)